jgi:hypothetical protein
MNFSSCGMLPCSSATAMRPRERAASSAGTPRANAISAGTPNSTSASPTGSAKARPRAWRMASGTSVAMPAAIAPIP